MMGYLSAGRAASAITRQRQATRNACPLSSGAAFVYRKRFADPIREDVFWDILMKVESCEKRNVTTEQAIELLKEEGYEVTEEQANAILDFLYFLGRLTVRQLLKADKKNADNLKKGKRREVKYKMNTYEKR